MTITDGENNIFLNIEFGKMKKKPKDHYEGDLIYKGKKISTISGCYLSHLDIDN